MGELEMEQFGAGELAGGDWEDVQYQPELDATLPQQDLGDENNDDTFGAFDGPLSEDFDFQAGLQAMPEMPPGAGMMPQDGFNQGVPMQQQQQPSVHDPQAEMMTADDFEAQLMQQQQMQPQQPQLQQQPTQQQQQQAAQMPQQLTQEQWQARFEQWRQHFLSVLQQQEVEGEVAEQQAMQMAQQHIAGEMQQMQQAIMVAQQQAAMRAGQVPLPPSFRGQGQPQQGYSQQQQPPQQERKTPAPASKGKNKNKDAVKDAPKSAPLIPAHLLLSGRASASNWPKQLPAESGVDGRMKKSVLNQIMKIQLYQIQGGQSAIGVTCDSYSRTVAAAAKKQYPVLYPARKEVGFKKSGALENALGKPTSLSIKNPRPLLQMVTAAEVAEAQKDMAPDSPDAEPENSTKRSWRVALLRTIEDCYSCVVEYEDMRYANEAGLSDSDKSEMNELMHTLMDRAFGIFTAVEEGPIAGAAAEDGSRVNGDVLLAVCSIPKGVQLLTRLLPLLPHETGSWTSAHEMIMAMLLNGQRISQLCENEVQQKLVAPIRAKIGAMDLLVVRNLLKKALDVLQTSTDAGASSVFSPIGCGIVTGMVVRGQQCISMGISSDRSRSQWRSISEKLLMCLMQKFGGGAAWVNNLGCFGNGLLAQISHLADEGNAQHMEFLTYIEQNHISK